MKHTTHYGFSLIELMTALAIASVIASWAVPSFRQASANAQVRQAANCMSESLSATSTNARGLIRTAELRPVSAGNGSLVWNNVVNDKSTVLVANSGNLNAVDTGKLATDKASWYVATIDGQNLDTLRHSCAVNDAVRVLIGGAPAPTVVRFDHTGSRVGNQAAMVFALCVANASRVYRVATITNFGSVSISSFNKSEFPDGDAGTPEAALKTLVGANCV